MDDKEKKKFYRFLKETGSLALWNSNMYKMPMTTLYQERYGNPSEYLNKIDKSDAVNCSFLWDHTKEGWDFWAQLSIEWNDIVYKRKKLTDYD